MADDETAGDMIKYTGFPRSPRSVASAVVSAPNARAMKLRALAALQSDFDLADKYPDMRDRLQAQRFCVERTEYYELQLGGVAQLRSDLAELAAYISALQALLRAHRPGQLAYEREALRAMEAE